MDLTFDVGVYERHRVVYSYQKFWGGLFIYVDNVQIIANLVLLSVGLTRTHQFMVGYQERHQVTIVKTRPLLLAWARPHTCKAYVDGYLVAEGMV